MLAAAFLYTTLFFAMVAITCTAEMLHARLTKTHRVARKFAWQATACIGAMMNFAGLTTLAVLHQLNLPLFSERKPELFAILLLLAGHLLLRDSLDALRRPLWLETARG